MAKKRSKPTAQTTDPAVADKLPALMDTPFAIHGDGFSQIQAAVDDLGTMQAIMARPGIRMDKTEYVTIRGNVAVVEIIGPIFHYDNILAWIFGFPSCEQLMIELQAVENNPAVQSIVLHIDSPGGQVGGVAELAAHIKNRITKPTVAYIGDMGASAAYWIASAADKITAAETSEVGSIGVVFTIRRTSDNQVEIVSSVSPKKRPDINTDEGRAVFQARADAMADVFVSTITANRSMTRDQVIEIGGDVVIASAAAALGLVDDTGNLEDVIETLQNGGITMPARKTQAKGEIVMTPEKLKTDHPETYNQVFASGEQQGKASAADETAQAVTAAETTAKASVIGLVAVVLGEDAKAKIDSVMTVGLTPEQVKVSMELFGTPAAPANPDPNAGTPTREQILAGIQAAAAPVAPAATDSGGTPDLAAEFMPAVDAHQKQNGCKRSMSIEAVAAANPEMYQAWLKAQQKK